LDLEERIVPKVDLTYPNLPVLLSSYSAPSRSESTAFLLWFLENIYRLDRYAAQDAVCDGTRDKGIDGIYIDENSERVDILQSHISTNPAKTLGDVALKEFAGVFAYFKDKAAVQSLAQQTVNAELKGLIEGNNIAEKVANGFEIRGVYITNMVPDPNTNEYLSVERRIHLYDRTTIDSMYVPPGEPSAIDVPVTFDLSSSPPIQSTVGGFLTVICELQGKDLIQMKGIDSGALFAWNVRQSLGRTKVNRDITESIRHQEKHKHFLLFHNGLTVLARSIVLNGAKMTLRGYTVVNGCQSLSSLYDNKDVLTDDLKVLTKIVQISPEETLAQEITHHSNNQNPINARDLQSNSSIQRRLQREFTASFGKDVFFTIKRGELLLILSIMN
jgi:hypothetical protein